METITQKPNAAAPVAVTYLSPETLKPSGRNSRQHSDKQIKQIAASIRQFGFNSPVIVDGANRIIAGHGRVLAAKELGLKEIPTIQVKHLTDAETRAYLIADNKLALNSSWDKIMLEEEIADLSSLDLNFDVEITGFSSLEIDALLQEEVETAAEDITPPVDIKRPAVCQPGDIWQLGNHRLICGDARFAETYEALLAGAKADMMFTDPPYNVPIAGNVSGLGKVKHKDFAMACGEMNEEEFIKFLTAFIEQAKAFSRDGALHYICMDWKHIYELQVAARSIYSALKNICVWNKSNGGMGAFYRSKHELVSVYQSGEGPAMNNIELGKHGRYRTNVWDYPGANSMSKGRMNDLQMHPTVKPVVMVADAIKDCTNRGQAVLDPFAGSGTTIIAAEKAKRIAYGIELDPHYCDVILKRWVAFTGEPAVHAVTGEAFGEIAIEEESADE